MKVTIYEQLIDSEVPPCLMFCMFLNWEIDLLKLHPKSVLISIESFTGWN